MNRRTFKSGADTRTRRLWHGTAGVSRSLLATLVVMVCSCTVVPRGHNTDRATRGQAAVTPTATPTIETASTAQASTESVRSFVRSTRPGVEASTDHAENKLERLARRQPEAASLSSLSDVGSLSNVGRIIPASLGLPLGGLDSGVPSFTLAYLQGAPAESSGSEVTDLRRRVEELERRLDGGQGTSGSSTSDSGSTDDLEVAGGEDDSTGTDPRSFGTKFMPYYRYTKLKNDLYTNELTLFGLVRLSESLAITYEVPVAKNIEYGSVREFKQLNAGGIPPGQGGGSPPTGIPVGDLESDGDNIGLGDSIFRVFFKNKHLRFDSPLGFGQLEIMPGFQQTWPTATNDVIGGEAWLGAPMIILVMDMPLNAFVAFMNFYEFDMLKDGSRESVERYIGRYFYMQPLTPPQFMAKDNPDLPDLGFWLSGLYVLPEFQPIYDFENDHFSFWVGPEFGKVFWEGRLLYAKPGWGIDQDRQDRQFTFEMGIRWFF